MTKFKSGESGNPKGRPIGSGHRQKLFNELVLPQKGKLLEKALDMAFAGNESMLKLLLERILPPKPKDEFLQITLSQLDSSSTSVFETEKQVINAVILGQLTLTQAKQIFSLLLLHQKNLSLMNFAENENHSSEQITQRIEAILANIRKKQIINNT